MKNYNSNQIFDKDIISKVSVCNFPFNKTRKEANLETSKKAANLVIELYEFVLNNGEKEKINFNEFPDTPKSYKCFIFDTGIFQIHAAIQGYGAGNPVSLFINTNNENGIYITLRKEIFYISDLRQDGTYKLKDEYFMLNEFMEKIKLKEKLNSMLIEKTEPEVKRIKI